MGDSQTKNRQDIRQLCVGLLAHVDAGKTTLSEGLLYLCGSLRERGRVDDENTYLDNDAMERERGITIFSKQAILDLPSGNTRITLLDTPGHVDFSSEMERTLQVMDYAILLIGGKDGVQGHTMTLWRLLERYRIPVFLFVNKMDQEGSDREALLSELQKRLDGNCVDFSDPDEGAFLENAAMCNEALMNQYLEEGTLTPDAVAPYIRDRKLFPVYFGSALKMDGVKEFLAGLEAYTLSPEYPDSFGARVFKISRDEQGNRLTFLKITGGSLKVKEILSGRSWSREKPEDETGSEKEPAAGGQEWSEKIDQIRLYSGPRYELAQEGKAGCVCAVTGLSQTYPGEGLGCETEAAMPVLEPVLNFTLLLPSDCNVHWMLRNMRELEEEDPQLHIVWDPHLKEIHVMLMGEVQTEILKRILWDRFHVAADFGPGNIVYKETIARPVIGVGHFEPLRHYAEVHLLLEPGEPGSGVTVFTACSEDVLARNWQRLILTHLTEKEHIGVLTGSAITDVQITLINGRAHVKHTEGGDFRQATYRAVRHALKKADSILLEPYYEFRIELPPELAGRAMMDVQKMGGSFQPMEMEGDVSVLKGSAPVSRMREYPKEVVAYSGGRGRIFCSLKGYAPVAEPDEIIEKIGYDSESDLDNPTGSVFCAHGAGFIVPWDQVEDYMHLTDLAEFEETVIQGQAEGAEMNSSIGFASASARNGSGSGSREVSFARNTGGKQRGKGASAMGSYEEDKELQAIFERTFGPVKRRVEPGSARRVETFGAQAESASGTPAAGQRGGAGSSAGAPAAGQRDGAGSSAGASAAGQRGEARSSAGASAAGQRGGTGSFVGASAAGQRGGAGGSAGTPVAGQRGGAGSPSGASAPGQRGGAGSSAGASQPGQGSGRANAAGSALSRYSQKQKKTAPKEEYLLVDGYNIIFAWPELRELAAVDIHAAAQKLIDLMGNYQGMTGSIVIVVFDAYKVEGHAEETLKFHNVDVVYTKEAETADMFIERTAHKLSKNHQVSVATSDGLEQIIIMGGGAMRLSASALKQEMEAAEKQMQSNWQSRRVSSRTYLMDQVPEEVLREIRKPD